MPALLLATTTALAIAMLGLPGTPDVGLFLSWMQAVDAHGIVQGYASFVEGTYPPLIAVLLAGVNALAAATGLSPHLTLKLSLLATLLFATAIVWAWTRDLRIAALFELTLVIGSAGLGYLDVYVMPPLLLALWALQRGRLELASALFTVSFLIKWQPAVLAPILLLFALGRPAALAGRGGMARVVASAVLPVLVLCGLSLWIFGPAVVDALRYAGGHPFLSGNALNLGWIATHVIRWLWPDWMQGLDQGLCRYLSTHDLRLLLPLKLLAVAVYLAVCVLHWRAPKTFANLLRFALLGYLAYAVLSSGVHENHLIVAGVLALLLFAFDRRELPTMVFWTVAANINLLLFYGLGGIPIGGERVLGGLDVAVLPAVLNVIAFVVLFARARRRTPLEPSLPGQDLGWTDRGPAPHAGTGTTP